MIKISVYLLSFCSFLGWKEVFHFILILFVLGSLQCEEPDILTCYSCTKRITQNFTDLEIVCEESVKSSLEKDG